MSGEPPRGPVVVLADQLRGLVVAAARLADAPLGPYAIVGGVAVNARLARANQRATSDVDAVVDEDTVPGALEVLARLDDRPDCSSPRDHRFTIAGTKVEVIGTSALSEADLAGLSDQHLLLSLGTVGRWKTPRP